MVGRIQGGRAVNLSYGIYGWVVVGALAGAIGGRIPDGEDGGLASVVTGVLGALGGGMVARAALGAPGGTGGLLLSLAGALVGAACFIFAGRKLSRLARTPAQSRRPEGRERPTRSST
jgi:uncharacterized membrane protein YeaQ/YmgE (transglycosylase-associated protein family)